MKDCLPMISKLAVSKLPVQAFIKVNFTMIEDREKVSMKISMETCMSGIGKMGIDTVTEYGLIIKEIVTMDSGSKERDTVKEFIYHTVIINLCR